MPTALRRILVSIPEREHCLYEMILNAFVLARHKTDQRSKVSIEVVQFPFVKTRLCISAWSCNGRQCPSEIEYRKQNEMTGKRNIKITYYIYWFQILTQGRNLSSSLVVILSTPIRLKTILTSSKFESREEEIPLNILPRVLTILCRT